MEALINQWRILLLGGRGSSRVKPFNHEEEMVDALVDRVDEAVRALKEKEVDLNPRRKSKRKLEEDDDFSPETKHAMFAVDKEVQLGGFIVRESQQRETRSSIVRKNARLKNQEGTSSAADESAEVINL